MVNEVLCLGYVSMGIHRVLIMLDNEDDTKVKRMKSLSVKQSKIVKCDMVHKLLVIPTSFFKGFKYQKLPLNNTACFLCFIVY